MPKNLHALIRYRAIDNILKRKGIQPNWNDLSFACGEALRYYVKSELPNPSRRTIFSDLDTMKHGKLGYHAPIEFDKQRGYYYSDPDFSITNTPINSDDVGELKQALVILKQFRGFKNVAGIENIVTKLEASLNLRTKPSKEIIQFDQGLDAPGREWLNPLYEYIVDEKVIQITYRPFSHQTPFLINVSPYLLKEYNKRWFLIAYNHEKDSIDNFALDRIESIVDVQQKYIVKHGFNLNIYFHNIIGVSLPRDGKLEKVKIKALPEQAKYLVTKPIHWSQKLEEETEDGCIFSFDVIPNYELSSVLLSFGEKVEVIRPTYLRDEIMTKLNISIKNYTGG